MSRKSRKIRILPDGSVPQAMRRRELIDPLSSKHMRSEIGGEQEGESGIANVQTACVSTESRHHHAGGIADEAWTLRRWMIRR